MKIFPYIFIVFFLFASCSSEQKSIKEEDIPIKVMVVNEEQVVNTRLYVGTIEESGSVALSFETSGNVEQVFVKNGDKVHKGQKLAQLDKKTAQSAYDAAKSTLDQAIDGYNRAKQLHDNGSLPEIKWVEIQTSLSKAKSLEEISRQRLQQCELIAPTNGVIGNRNIEVGTNISPLQPVFKILNISNLKVKFSVPENEIAKLNLGDKLIVEIAALNNKQISATVSEKSINADPLSRSYAVWCLLDEDVKDLLPGMICKLFTHKIEQNAFVVPANCVKTTKKDLSIWKIENNLAKIQEIKSHEFVNNGVLISQGLSKGDTIVIEGYQKLYEGAKVKIIN